MKNLTVEEFEKRLAAIPVVEPDEWDLQMLAEIDAEKDDGERFTLEEIDRIRARREVKSALKCSGKIAVRVPKELHYKLLESAKQNGVSLNQFIVYKLAQ